MDNSVKSILDNDLYKFSMGWAYMNQYPDAEGTFEFYDRNNTYYSDFIVNEIKQQFECDLAKREMSYSELNWCIKTMPYIPMCYWEWLRGFHFDPEKINIWADKDKHLHITVTDKLYKATLYEVPILAIVSEVCNSANCISMTNVLDKLDKKIELSNEYKLYFSEFGTRRRFSYEVQDAVINRLSTKATFCTGTSNVFFAYKYNMKPIGTVAHEWVMFHGSNFGYRRANYEAYEAWVRVFDGNLGIALTDTFTLDAFLNNFSMKQAKLFDGVRQDSGDEREFVYKVVNRYKELGINPLNKTIVFSNALDFPKFKEIAEFCKGKIGMCCAGIGTNLTNDTGFKPSNIVMKLMRCRMNSNQEFNECIKISDDAGKLMGNQKELEICLNELNIKR